jgi:hypothetical protein
MLFFGSSSLVVFTQIRGERRAPVDTTAAMEQDWLGKPTEGSQGLAHFAEAITNNHGGIIPLKRMDGK